MAEKNKVGCLWINYPKDTTKKPHSNIIIDNKRYVAFPNDFKDKPEDPDWLIYDNTPQKPQ